MTESRLSLSDRAICAALSACAAAASVGVLALLLLVRAEAWSTYFWSRVLPLMGAAVCLASVAGFMLGPDRTATLFGLAWGTQKWNAAQAAVVLVLVLLACFWLAT